MFLPPTTHAARLSLHAHAIAASANSVVQHRQHGQIQTPAIAYNEVYNLPSSAKMQAQTAGSDIWKLT
jgi:hypothetical protein